MGRHLWLVAVVLVLAGLWVVTRLVPRGPHAHAPGPHGGGLVSLGGDRFHVEAVVGPNGRLELFTLGADATRVADVEWQEPAAYARAEGDAAAVVLPLRPEPQAGDGRGRTSRFVGEVPDGLRGRAVGVMVPSLRFGRERFRVAFTLPGPAMPAGAAEDEARELYLTPAGAYTAADVEANGRKTAAERYRGFRAEHDPNPKPGARVCPVTRTKADPRCTWVIGGRTYQFCCPPCIDETVRLARERPKELLPPEEYVRR